MGILEARNEIEQCVVKLQMKEAEAILNTSMEQLFYRAIRNPTVDWNHTRWMNWALLFDVVCRPTQETARKRTTTCARQNGEVRERRARKNN